MQVIAHLSSVVCTVVDKCRIMRYTRMCGPPSSSGLGLCPFTAATRIRIPLGVLKVDLNILIACLLPISVDFYLSLCDGEYGNERQR